MEYIFPPNHLDIYYKAAMFGMKYVYSGKGYAILGKNMLNNIVDYIYL